LPSIRVIALNREGIRRLKPRFQTFFIHPGFLEGRAHFMRDALPWPFDWQWGLGFR